MEERNRRIEDLAGAILDGGSIDWTSEESSADFSERSVLDQLRVIAAVADVHRLPFASNRSDARAAVEPPAFVDTSPAMVDGKYLIEASLGRGGMGFVYRARHIELGKPFAVKLVQPHISHRLGSVARFRVEAHALGRLNHPNIVQVTDFGVDAGAGPYLVMEYIDGVPLSEYLKYRGALPFDEALPIFRCISRALDHAHRSGILHRDLKPANVLLLTHEGTPRDAKIVDFGIASFVETPDAVQSVSESAATMGSDEPWGTPPAAQPAAVHPRTAKGLTAPGMVVGTLDYIAPEVMNGEKATASGDIYAFGVLIYETLTGKRPSDASADNPADPALVPSPPLPSAVCASVPAELDRAILKPLNSDPRARPASARDVVIDLRDANYRASVRRWRRTELPRRAVLSIAAFVLVLLLYAVVQGLPPVQALENMALDARVSLQRLRPPDPRIVLISIDEATLSLDATPLTAKADEVGTLLGQVFAAGARAMAIDLLLPQQWSGSESFSRLILDHSERIVLASYSDSDGNVSGPESVQGLMTVALGRERIERLFGFVNLSADADGVVRTIPVIYRDQQGKAVSSLAARIAEILAAPNLARALTAARVSIDYSIDWTSFRRVAWKDLSTHLASRPETFRDRVILVGGEFAGSGDVFRANPIRGALPQEISGLALQALTLNTLLEGNTIRPWNADVGVGLLALAIAVAVMAVLYLPTSGPAMSGVAIAAILYIFCSILAFRWSHRWLPIIAPGVMVGAALMCAVWLRRTLSPFPAVAPEETS